MIRSSQGLGALRLWDQVSRNLLGLQHDMRSNALTWQGNAKAGSVPVDKLRGWMADAAKAYQTRAQWVVDLRATDRWADVMAVGASYGVSEAEVVDMLDDVGRVADALAASKLTTYADMRKACDRVLAEVPPLESLWPE